MNTAIYKSFLLSAALFLTAACAKDTLQGTEPTVDPGKDDAAQTIRFKAAVVSGSQISIKDAGLYIGDPIFADNVKLSIADDGTVTPAVPVKWAENQTKNSDFIAYSPYDSSYGKRGRVVFKVQPDQSTQAALKASDLLVAKTMAKPSDEAVALEFNHVLSQILVYFDNKTDKQIQSVEFQNIANSVELDLESGDVYSRQTATDLTAFKDDASGCFRLIVPSGSYDLSLKITLSDGTFLIRTAKNIWLEQGKYYDNVREPIVLEDVKAQAITLNFAVSDWVDGGQLDFNKGNGYDSIADLTSTATTEPRNFTANVKNLKITYIYPDGSKAFAQDLSGGVQIYGNCSNLWGQYTGEISGAISLHNGLPQITLLDVSKAQYSSGKLTSTVLTLEELINSFDRYISCPVELDGIRVTKSVSTGSTTDRTGEIEQNGKTIKVYNDTNEAILTAGFTGNLYAFPSIYKGEKELLVCSSDWFVGEATIAAAFRNSTVGGFYSVSADSCTPLLTMAPGIQATLGNRSDYVYVNFFDAANSYSVNFRLVTDHFAVGESYKVDISSLGTTTFPSGTFNYTLLKFTDLGAWLYSEENGTGIIIENN